MERVAKALIVIDDGDDASVTLHDLIADTLVVRKLVHRSMIEPHRGGG
jgi:hypothetical protein